MIQRKFAALPTPINYTCVKCGSIISVTSKDQLPQVCGQCGSTEGFTCTMDEIRRPRV